MVRISPLIDDGSRCCLTALKSATDMLIGALRNVLWVTTTCGSPDHQVVDHLETIDLEGVRCDTA